LGDIFEIGPHRLICGDSTQADTFNRLFGQQMADLVITDPPYNVSYEGKTKKKPSKNLQNAYHYLGKAIEEHQ
jgi:DNA modification methylase